ncbi:hypothetical protein F2P56_005178 [Juglans regia]|uniref:Uncharacterized protein LOC109010495 n=2 Tax=Juglans regia TaxID=51240 RepID=A0A2I4GSM0_JUGRE|nr:uncharacterized protein LOC109010495 [Juglans regia]KAF5478635.1 hypothetical protein F2P56_005178 [Juglans regia]
MCEKISIIRKKLAIAQERQKKYANQRIQELEFEEDSKVLLKVAPMKWIMRFGKTEKLIMRYIGSFEILERIEVAAYNLALQPQLSAIHNVFHVSMLRKYAPDPCHVLEHEPLHIRDDFTYEEFSARILAHNDQVLRNKIIKMVKVHWSHHTEREATWEREEDMKEKYPYLF